MPIEQEFRSVSPAQWLCPACQARASSATICVMAPLFVDDVVAGDLRSSAASANRARLRRHSCRCSARAACPARGPRPALHGSARGPTMWQTALSGAMVIGLASVIPAKPESPHRMADSIRIADCFHTGFRRYDERKRNPALLGDLAIGLVDRGDLLGGDGDEFRRHAARDQLVGMVLGDELAVLALQLIIADAGLNSSSLGCMMPSAAATCSRPSSTCCKSLRSSLSRAAIWST